VQTGGKGYRLIQALVRMRERCLMKPDESTYKIVEVPLPM
jgi:mRNA-degrading endonuclease HigB of HigAB toxin-antitoxin module